MLHYWGAEAICERLGLSPRASKRLPDYIKRYGVPAYKRKHGHRLVREYYASEGSIQAYELSRAKLYREELIAQDERKRSEQGKRQLTYDDPIGRAQARSEVA